MKIEIISDTICPWCFIGKRRFERALELRPQPDVEVTWHPYQLNPDMPVAGMDRQTFLAARSGGAARAGRRHEVIAAAGRGQGIEFRFDLIPRTPNTLASHRLVHLAGLRQRQDVVVEALFQAYFTDGWDIGDMSVLAAIAAEAGLDRLEAAAYLAGDEDEAFVLAEDERNRTLGVNGVPCFIIEGTYAVCGAQSPEIFHQLFDLIRADADAAGAAAAE
jgi:predicted DsbA family dithiol-disulfide isomerase